MNHVKEMLSAYMDHELPASEKEEVEKHLQTCSDCRDALDRLMEMKMLLAQSLEEIEIPEAFTNKVMLTIDQREQVMISREDTRRRPSLFSNRALQRGVIASILLLFIADGVLMSAFAFLLSFQFLSFFVGLSHAVLTLITALPYIGTIVSVTSLLVIPLFGWCLWQLLSSKKVELWS
ncbi:MULTISPECIES: zf-HC2 domain-containing protein [unclassified Thermoactinomyces]|uniref:anti-sigma factor family protein n=1 Tax=unclassified Thermoactinomyces TaxID=2634588 RepID=UPI0018DE6B33|nr:zf-HC2 domain-containing protein [Thermoactinomyces sp. CICC 10523]MBH8602833.1 zf-HC2 domain-containing protein [Thermoactinomyces sp. CICC 10522]